jgi:glutamyl-Q tRNA(Asp) synthetase
MSQASSAYIGRFAPSPTGPLHAGSLVAALASWLDARAHFGQWLVRIEDVDTPRCVPGADRTILAQLATCGLVSDGPVLWQSQRHDAYQAALQQLIDRGWAYPCGCSRKDIEEAQAQRGHHRERHHTSVYPGTCRDGLQGKSARAWRLNVQRVIDELQLPPITEWQDRRWGTWKHPAAQVEDHAETNAHAPKGTPPPLQPLQQNVPYEVGDFVLKRADGLWAYQLAVVVDDAHQGISHVVRGDDLRDNTARQIVLQHALNLPTPQYLHTPLVLADNGEKLSKQNGAQALDLRDPLAALCEAANTLGLSGTPATVEEALTEWTMEWSLKWLMHGPIHRSKP